MSRPKRVVEKSSRTTSSTGSSNERSDESSEERLVNPLLLLVRSEMPDAWRKDEHLLAKFFPVEPIFASAYQNARKHLYNDRRNIKRWMRIPSKPISLLNLYTPLTQLFNGIASHFGISKFRRLFLDTHIRSRKSREIEPGIVLAGIGSEFGNTIVPIPRADHHSCISPFEIVLESDDMSEARDRLAVHVHRIWQTQENRRFAPGLVITQNVFTVYMFDHAGAVASEPCNYHENPEQFCAVIAGLAGEGARIGFDITMESKSGCSILSTFETRDGLSNIETRYDLEARLFQFSSFVGRGTYCWLASLLDDPRKLFIIKDAWIAEGGELEGRESEGALLQHAQTKGVTTGVPRIHHIENVRRSADPSDWDTILRNRQTMAPSPPERNFNRIHTRIVMKTYGKTLDTFSNKKELILAFHDAVLAHRNLHQVAGILHRDVSARNILINVNGVEGDRGILIDFDHAIRVVDTSPYSTKRKIGTWRYMSRNVHDGDDPHTYLDDLESFYYVWVWILVAYQRPGVSVSEPSNLLLLWDVPCASLLKEGLMSEFRLPLSPWFGSCFHNLALRFFQFFKCRRHSLGPKPDPVKDYDEFLGHIRRCIAEMEVEDKAIQVPSTGHGNGGSHVGWELAPGLDAKSSHPPVPPPVRKNARPVHYHYERTQREVERTMAFDDLKISSNITDDNFPFAPQG